MKYIEKLKLRQKEIVSELRKLQNKAEAESRNLNADEQASFDKLEKDCDDTDQSIKREERQIERERSTGGSYETKPPVEERGASGDGEEERGTAAKKPAGPFKNLGDQLSCIIRAAGPTGQVDRRLLEVRSPSGMSETVPADGGFLIQQDYMADLTSKAYDTGVLSKRCTRLPIGPGKNGIKISMLDEISRANGSRFGGVQAFWAGEGEQKTKSQPKLRQMDLTLKKLVGLIPITDELLEDAVALESWVSLLFAQEFGFKVDDAIINGSGVGQPLGILNSPALVTQADEATQAAGVIMWKNIVKMYSRLTPSSIGKAAWFYNPEVFPVLATMQFDPAATAGQMPLFIPANSAAGQPFNTLLGLPMIPIEQAAALNSPGDLILADLSQYLLIEKGGIQTAMSIHVRFEYDESMLRFVLRTDGQPMLRSPITPYKGSATLSPFVVLDTRNGS